MALARIPGWRRDRHLGVRLWHRLLDNADLDQFWLFLRSVPRVPRSHVRPGIPDDW